MFNDNNNYEGSLNTPLSDISAIATEIYWTIETLEKQLQEERLERFIKHLCESLKGE
jgi:hypothetical protein